MTHGKNQERVEALLFIIEQILELPIYLPKHIRDQIDTVLKYKPCGRCKCWKPPNAYDQHEGTGELYDHCIACTDYNRSRKKSRSVKSY